MKAVSSELVQVDFCVAGAGISGICAAVAAARRGVKVALVHNRSVLGGNASSEIRQAIGGACFSGQYHDAREAGIVDEIWSEIRQRCVGNNMNDYAESSVWLQDFCAVEPNLDVYLNTHIAEVEKEGRAIVSVSGFQMTTGRNFVFKARQFADCTGDANVAFLAGCAYMSGQEGRDAFNESLAPEKATKLTMGNSLLFQTEVLDRPVPYERPEWVPDLKEIECYWTIHPPTEPMAHGSWVFEYGGKMDTILDAEKIQKELYRILYAAWADLKSRPELKMDNYRISFISAIPGKRESRRVIGDYIVNQNDIVSVRRFPDDVAYAGWSLDLHNHDGFWGKDRPTTFYLFPEIHSIPLRSLYARDVDNLWLAGRDISVTHIALGGARLMASCGLAGEAVGIAASVGHAKGLVCREIAEREIKRVQQEILKAGGFIPGITNDDPCDQARRAEVTATSQSPLGYEMPVDYGKIGNGIGLAFPVTGGRLETLTVAVKNPTGQPVKVKALLQPIRYFRDFHPTQLIKEAEAVAAPDSREIKFAFNVELEPDAWMVHLIASDPELLIGEHRSRKTGVFVGDHFPEGKEDIWARELGMPEPPLWVRRFNHHRLSQSEVFQGTPCFEITPRQFPYAPANVINGINRPTRLPNLWISEKGLPQTLKLAWKEPVPLSEVRIVFDGDMDLPQPPITPGPTLVADYDLFAINPEGETLLASVRNNRQRFVIHCFQEIAVSSLRLEILAMNSEGREARVAEIRCY